MNNTTINDTSITASDDQTDLITFINLLNKIISQYGLGLIWFIGNIGSVLTCMVFYQPTYDKSPCAMYFLVSSFAQFFTFNFPLLTRLLQYGYDIKTVNISLGYCKFRYYCFYVSVAIPRYAIVIASIDRYFASSRNALRRQWSSPKIAFRLIIGNIILWCIIYIQVLVFYEIRDHSCQPQAGAYGMFFSIYISIDSGILPTLLMLIFGLLTVRNVHQTRKRIGIVRETNDGRPIQTGKISKKELQLHKMIANQIILYIIFNIPNPCYLVYNAFTINTEKSAARQTIEVFINNMTYLLVYFGFSLTFATFVISSGIFRREFLQLIRTKILRQPLAQIKTSGRTRVKLRRQND
ncbi:unnamed protein product [Adineta steineri]|uniref:G-protein coupled receptors family 1 profile domain-containing protein n=1 Tax=Adineta steineri TaxID=433720 RepID=A0A814DGT3_9BILA|nr:unnamed protein product [Adineta steineri]CAF3743672.1 unnamed protein product [Adineta steineri]